MSSDCEGVSARTGHDYCGDDELTTSDLQEIIGVSTFQGLTGIVAFNGNDPTSTAQCAGLLTRVAIEYEIFQRRSSGVLVQVGVASGTAGISGLSTYNNETGVTTGSSLFQWKNGKQPVSGTAQPVD